MTARRSAAILAALVLIPAAGGTAPPDGDICAKKFQETFRETFRQDSNEGGWTWGNAFDFIEAKGGSPGAFLRNDYLDSAMPGASTRPGGDSIFTGDYRAEGVVALEAEFKTIAAGTTGGRPLTMMLLDDNGTLDVFDDDAMVFLVGEENIPEPFAKKKRGWVSYTFEVPSGSDVLPEPHSGQEGEPGWVAAEAWYLNDAPADPDAVWNRVIQSVDRVIYFFHDPRYFAIMQMWDVGLDNPSVTMCRD